METKTQNYTQQQTLELVTRYQAGTSVEDLALAMGKSIRSVVAKLSREGVYQSKPKASGNQRVTKLDMVKQLSNQLDMEWEAIKNLEQVDKPTLEALVAAVVVKINQ